MRTPKNPQPTTVRAVLKSAAPGAGWTPHVWTETRACDVDDAKGAPSPAWEHVFTCQKTGTTRRWGLEARVGTALAPEFS